MSASSQRYAMKAGADTARFFERLARAVRAGKIASVDCKVWYKSGGWLRLDGPRPPKVSRVEKALAHLNTNPPKGKTAS